MQVPASFATGEQIAGEDNDASTQPADSGWQLAPCDVSKQEKTEWCWAAVIQAIERRYDGSNRSQCEIAREFIGAAACGEDCETCNHDEPLSVILRAEQHLVEPIKGPLLFVDIKNEIDAKHPICCHIDRSPHGHFLVICGYNETDGAEKIVLMDPAPNVGDGPQSHDYAQFVIAYEEGGRWDESYLTA